jgi:hypothetical protein
MRKKKKIIEGDEIIVWIYKVKKKKAKIGGGQVKRKKDSYGCGHHKNDEGCIYIHLGTILIARCAASRSRSRGDLERKVISPFWWRHERICSLLVD